MVPIQIDIQDAKAVIDTLLEASCILWNHPFRKGSLIDLPEPGTTASTGADSQEDGEMQQSSSGASGQNEAQARTPAMSDYGNDTTPLDQADDGTRKIRKKTAMHQNVQQLTTQIKAPQQLMMSGDLHDHVVNLSVLYERSGIDISKRNYLVLHEVIHGKRMVNGMDLSIRMIARVASLIVQYPYQVLQILSNHEMAQLSGSTVLKGGRNVIEGFNAGINYLFPDHVQPMQQALLSYLASLPLAIRCPNGILLSHSLPGPDRMPLFDSSVLYRKMEQRDYIYGGHAHAMVWGRKITPDIVEDLIDDWQVELFITGHQHAVMGCDVQAEKVLILASDHENGVGLPIDLKQKYVLKELVENLISLSAAKDRPNHPAKLTHSLDL